MGQGLNEKQCSDDCDLTLQGEQSAVRYLFQKGLEVNYRSRYVYLSWALFERDMGKVGNARELFRRGHALNPQDPAILQVRSHVCAADTERCAQGRERILAPSPTPACQCLCRILAVAAALWPLASPLPR